MKNIGMYTFNKLTPYALIPGGWSGTQGLGLPTRALVLLVSQAISSWRMDFQGSNNTPHLCDLFESL